MSQEQRAALCILLASRSGARSLHDIHHRCGDHGRITAPTLVISSQYDGSVDLTHARQAADHLPHAELSVRPAERHLLWFSPHAITVEEKMRVFLPARSPLSWLEVRWTGGAMS